MNSLDSISPTLRMEIELRKNDIDYYLSENTRGSEEIIIPMERIKDKNKFHRVMANYYEQMALKYGKNDFLAFLAKEHLESIRGVN